MRAEKRYVTWLAAMVGPEVDASTLNTAALSTGPAFNIFATTQGEIVPTLPAFVDFRPGAYLGPSGGEGGRV